MPSSKLKILDMPKLKNELDGVIARARDVGDSSERIVRRLFYFRRSPITVVHEDPIFDIFDSVAARFNVPFKSIYVSGSAQTGHSLYKNRDFIESESDLDLAIVDANLFQRYAEISYVVTKGYSDLRSFQTRRDVNDVPQFFKKNLARGWFRPDLMPNCRQKTEWHSFFQGLSNKYINTFKGVSCGIYLSQTFFEGRLVKTLNNYKI